MIAFLSATEIGKRLKHLRGSRTLDEVSTATGISCSALGMYEIGKRVPKDENKVRLAKYYEVPVEIFFSSDYHDMR